MREEVQYDRAIDIPGLVLSTARFAEFRFEPHYHLDCHIALVTDGVQRQTYQGESLLLSRGAIQLMPPGRFMTERRAQMSHTRCTLSASRLHCWQAWVKRSPAGTTFPPNPQWCCGTLALQTSC